MHPTSVHRETYTSPSITIRPRGRLVEKTSIRHLSRRVSQNSAVGERDWAARYCILKVHSIHLFLRMNTICLNGSNIWSLHYCHRWPFQLFPLSWDKSAKKACTVCCRWILLRRTIEPTVPLPLHETPSRAPSRTFCDVITLPKKASANISQGGLNKYEPGGLSKYEPGRPPVCCRAVRSLPLGRPKHFWKNSKTNLLRNTNHPRKQIWNSSRANRNNSIKG